MKYTKNLLSDQVLGRKQTLARGDYRESASASLTPPSGVGNRQDSLLYHSETNSDKQSEKKAYKPTSKQAKTFKALELNSKHWLKIYSEENIGILTCTYKENLKCHKESQRRWNNLNRLINRDKTFDVLVR